MFHPCDPSNEPGTCNWCGRKLRPYPFRDARWREGQGKELGGYGDNHFCGLRCGYLFGVQFAQWGHRIKMAEVS